MQMRRLLSVALAGVAILGGSRADAAPIIVHNTGVDATDALVPVGGVAAFWTLASAPVGATEAIGSFTYEHRNPAYAANTAVSQWVSPSPSGDASVFGDFFYETVFDLTGFEASTAVVSGLFSSDNNGLIRLNGGAPVVTLDDFSFKSMHAFTFTSGFLPGLNVIQVGVRNIGNPTAFHVQFTETAARRVPEPGSMLLLSLGLLALRLTRRSSIQGRRGSSDPWP
jgi:hypothetical protein